MATGGRTDHVAEWMYSCQRARELDHLQKYLKIFANPLVIERNRNTLGPTRLAYVILEAARIKGGVIARVH